MACNITVLYVLGLVFQGNTVPSEIRVKGAATECSSVEVTIERGGILLPSETAGVCPLASGHTPAQMLANMNA
jgi:hypothetical protein